MLQHKHGTVNEIVIEALLCEYVVEEYFLHFKFKNLFLSLILNYPAEKSWITNFCFGFIEALR